MKIIATGLSYNEADVIADCVTSALTWCDEFVLYDSSTDNTAELAEEAGAIVIGGNPHEHFSEQLRQHTLNVADELCADWIVRIDPDEFYPIGASIGKDAPIVPRDVIEIAAQQHVQSLRAHVIQFWITLDDVRRGLLLENEKTPVDLRRRWYSFGYSAVVAWQHQKGLRYATSGVANTPVFVENGVNIGSMAGSPRLIQTHYPCRSWPQLWQRALHRRQYKKAFGKYLHNLVIDEQVAGLTHWNGGPFSPVNNHAFLYKWYEKADELFKLRGI